MEAEIVQVFRIEAAHYLPAVPARHPCCRVHGHSYKIEVHLQGPVDEHTGFVVDFFDLESAFAPVMQTLDHQVLNEVEGLANPTSERLAAWIWHRLIDDLPTLSAVTVHETDLCRATFRATKPAPASPTGQVP